MQVRASGFVRVPDHLRARYFPRHAILIARLLPRLLRPTVWVTAERAFAEFFFLLLFAIQAPILGPAAFGLVAAVMVFVAFWEQVPGHALVEALLSIRQIEDRHYSTVTLASALLCLVMGAGLFGLAGPLALAFGNGDLAPVMRVMSVLPFIQAFSTTPLAAAQRDMRFQSTTLRTIVSLVAGGAVGLGLALTGAGVWALVWQAIVQRLVAVFVLWFAIPLPFGLALSRRHLKEVTGFALPIMLSRVMGWASGQLPRLVLGFYLGPTDLGLFSIASRLNYIVSQVAISPKATTARVALCSLVDSPDAFRHAVRKMFARLSILAFPACVGGAAVVPTLFHAWLDQRWYGAILPSQLMLLGCMPYVTFYGSTALLYALNLQKREAGVATALSLGGLIAVVVGGSFGLVTSTAAIALFALAAMPFSLVVIRRGCGLTVADVLVPQVPAFVSACVMGAVVSLLCRPLEAAYPRLIALGIELAAGAGIYGALLVVLTSDWTERVIGGPVRIRLSGRQKESTLV